MGCVNDAVLTVVTVARVVPLRLRSSGTITVMPQSVLPHSARHGGDARAAAVRDGRGDDTHGRAPQHLLVDHWPLARHLQEATGITIKKLVQTPRPLRTVTIDIDIDGHELSAHTTPELLT